jgi:hypothetical protein
MSFCLLEEAFQGPPSMQMGSGRGNNDVKSLKKKKNREHFTPSMLGSAPAPTGVGSAVPDPDRQAAPPPPANDILSGPPMDKYPTEGIALDKLFPLPGETGESEEWEKAFTLEGSRMPPVTRPDGSVVVAGQPTLWRQIAAPAAPVAAMPGIMSTGAEKLAAIPSEINQRLENLTRQLESLNTPTALQGTAELFLFVAIGLMILLAIDTMLRFAVSLSERKIMAGGALLRSTSSIR